MKSLKIFSVMVACLMLTVAAAPIITYMPIGSSSSSFDGFGTSGERQLAVDEIGIYNAVDLTKIGNDPNYPLDGSYRQMADIDFTNAPSSHLSTRGYEIKVTASIASSQIVFQIQYRANGSTGAWTNASNTSLTYAFGNVATVTANTSSTGTYTITNASSSYGAEGYSDIVFSVGGTMNGGTFAFSMEIPAGMTSGTVTKESYQKGNFYPIGLDPVTLRTSHFKGKYDGNNFEIKGLEIAVLSSSEANRPYVGLFGYATGAELTNIGISAIQNGSKGIWGSHTALGTAGATYAGSIAGTSNSSITNCYNTGIISALSTSSNDAHAGGVAGSTANLISKCYNTGSIFASISAVSASRAYVGGIAAYGHELSDISGCYNTGTIISSSNSSYGHAGGIVGRTFSTISDCYNTGTISASSPFNSYAAGIAGESASMISKCYNNGSVTSQSSSTFHGAAFAAGIVADSSSTSDCYNIGSVYASCPLFNVYAAGIAGYVRSMVSNCYNAGSISTLGNNLYVGGIAADVSSDKSIYNSYFSNEGSNSGLNIVGKGSPAYYGNMNLTGYTLSQLKAVSTYNTTSVGPNNQFWDWDNVWKIDTSGRTNDGLPYLYSASFPGRSHSIVSSTNTNGTGTGGSISPSGSTEVINGGSMTYTLSAAGGYRLVDVLVDGVSVPSAVSAGSYTFSDVTSDHTIVAVFSKQYSVTYSQSPAGAYTITPESGYSTSGIVHGGDFKFKVSAVTGYTGTIVVKVGSVTITHVSGVYTVSNITSDTVISFTGLSKQSFTVSVPNGTGYTVDKTSQSVEYGGTATFKIRLATGYTDSAPVVKVGSTTLSPTSVSGNVYTYTITNVTANQSVTVSVVKNTYTVTLPSGTGFTSAFTSGSSSVQHGGSVIFTITVDASYNQKAPTVKVNNVVVNPTSTNGNVYTYTITNITENKSVTATVVKNTYTVTVPNGTGYTVDKTSQTVEYGSSAIFKITVDVAYNGTAPTVKANGVTLTPSVSGNVYTYTISNVTANQSVTVSVVKNIYSVAVPNGTGYTVDKTSQTVEYGASATFRITLQTGYTNTAPVVKANGVTLTPSVSGNVYTYTISNVTANQSVTVEAVKNTYSVTLPSGTGYVAAFGSGSSSSVQHGGSVTFTITVDVAYNKTAPVVKVNNVVVNHSSLNGNVYTYTISNITANQSITATVTKNTYIVSVPNGTGYMVDKTSQTVEYGSSATFTITLQAGYTDTAPVVKVNGSVLTATSVSGNVYTYTITNITADQSVTVTVVKNTYSVTMPAGTGYTMDKSTQTVEHGTDLTFMITVDADHNKSVPIVKVNGIVLTATSVSGDAYTYTISNVVENKTVTVEGLTENVYTVSMSPGTGTILNSSGRPVHGEKYQFTATLKAGYVNLKVMWSADGISWSDASYVSGNIYQTSANVMSDIWLKTEAEQGQYSVTVDNGHGHDPSSVIIFAKNTAAGGEYFYFEVYTAPGYKSDTLVVKWFDGSQWKNAYNFSGNIFRTTEFVTGEISIQAYAEYNIFNVTVEAGTGTTINADPTAQGGQFFEFEAISETGSPLLVRWYNGAKWQDATHLGGNMYSTSEVVSSDITVSAAVTSFKVTVIDVTGVTVNVSETAAAGKVLYFTLTVEPGYVVTSVIWNNAGIWEPATFISGTLYRTEAVRADVTIMVSVRLA